MFSSEQWLANSGADFYNGVATQSLRFDDGSSAYLNKTFSTPTNNKIYTFSSWVKRSELSRRQAIFGAGSDGNNENYIGFNADNTFYFQTYSHPSQYRYVSSAIYRDISAWYHCVVEVDTTLSSADDRVKLYINGERISIGTQQDIPLNYNSRFNSAVNHGVGYSGNGSYAYYVDGYMAETNFVDGLSLDASYFGETKNGVWIAKTPNVSDYGTNGFRLQFDQVGVGTASTSTIGADTSGKTNHFTSSGIVASDCAMIDSPENNFATIDPLSSGAGVFSEGNLKYVSTADTGNATFGISSGKAYVEVYVSSVSNSFIGVLDISNGLSPTRGGSFTTHGAIAYKQNGDQYSLPVGSSSATASYGASYTNGDIIGIAFDVDADTITFYKNGASQGNTANGVSHISSNGVYSILLYASGTNFVCNFGQDASFAGAITAGTETDGTGAVFKYAPPSGFLALSSKNLPEPTIGANSDTQADDHFNTVLYTGNESSRSIAVGFQSDWVWIKNRETTRYHRVYDSSRGATKALYTNGSDAEETNSTELTAFNSNGFTLGAGVGSNENNDTFVSWNWKAGGTPTATNSAGAGNTPTAGSVKIDGVNLGSALAGSIPATKLSANTTAGFSIVSYTGNATAGATVGHGLNFPVEMTIGRRYNDATSWHVYHTGMDSANNGQAYMYLDATTAVRTSTEFFTAKPSSSVVTLGNYATMNGSSDTIIMYAFHSVEGYSKFGSYTGNGSADGSFVYVGFDISFIMIKDTTVAGNNWFISDSVRDIDNPVSQILYPSTSGAEDTAIYVDFVSNGFKQRNNYSSVGNKANSKYIYMAFGSSFKYANAR